ncbi:MAG: hypothetical protein KC503_19105 [Myxococcales bacterium]|nr:hypothetical protein [Myxococcales bacterium]
MSRLSTIAAAALAALCACSPGQDTSRGVDDAPPAVAEDGRASVGGDSASWLPDARIADAALLDAATSTSPDATLDGPTSGMVDSGSSTPPPPPPPPPALPAIRSNGLHTVHIDDNGSWNSIYELTQQHGAPAMICSQNRSPHVPADSWCKNVHTSHYPTGAAMADAIARILQQREAAKVMIDELKTSTQGYVKACADRLRAVYPQLAGRWGAYLVNGSAVSYPVLAAGIDALLDARAIIAAEMYPHYSSYCGAGSTTAARDVWLAAFFRGSGGAFPQGRFHWLAQRRKSRASQSQLTVLFGVTDAFLDGTKPALFVDRMFYIWLSRSGYPSTLGLANGGPGAWKWDKPYMSNSSRDLAFKQSFEHYVVQDNRASRLGPVPCP